ATSVTLGCLVTGYFPGPVTMTWDTASLNRSTLTFPAVQNLNSSLYTTSSQVTVSGEWSKQKFTCSVAHAASNTTTTKAVTGDFPDPSVKLFYSSCDPRGDTHTTIHPPTPLDLYVNKSPKITCLVVDLASDKDMTLTWSTENKDLVYPDPPIAKTQFNGTVTVTSTLPVDVSDWIEGETYYCKVAHPHLPKEILRSISKGPGKRMIPEVYVFPPPKEELKTKGEVTLTCLIQNFFPADISVRWLRNGAPMQADQHTSTGPHRVRGSSPAFFVYSHLAVKQADWQQRSMFTCQVVHEALSGQGADRLTPAELALEDLCAEAAESEELQGTRTSLLTFVALFLLSVSYSATVTLCKVGTGAPFQGGVPRERENLGLGTESLTHAVLPGEVGPGRRPAGAAAGFPRLHRRCTALPFASSCEQPRGGQLYPGPEEGAEQPPRGQSQGPSDQHTGAQRPQLSPKGEGDKGAHLSQPHTTPLWGKSQKSICSLRREAWAGRGCWPPQASPRPLGLGPHRL
uniref:Ig-like domain-containing protein n=1 Tax=Balaenoptera musculus TaxID=9771 RepID=A0A8C0DBK6_BALMU